MNTSGNILSFVFIIFSYIMLTYAFMLNCRSVNCFKLGWPMRADADFFRLPIGQLRAEKSEVKKILCSCK